MDRGRRHEGEREEAGAGRSRRVRQAPRRDTVRRPSPARLRFAASLIGLLTLPAFGLSGPSRAGPPDADAAAKQGEKAPGKRVQGKPAVAAPLLVPVRSPQRPQTGDAGASSGTTPSPRPWIAIPMPDGGLAWIRLPKLDERTQWRPDDTFLRAQSLLRPALDFDSRPMLGTRARLGRLMGGRWLHLSDAQIHAHFGRLPDGSQPLVSGRGIYSGMFTTDGGSLAIPNILPDAHPMPIDLLGH